MNKVVEYRNTPSANTFPFFDFCFEQHKNQTHPQRHREYPEIFLSTEETLSCLHWCPLNYLFELVISFYTSVPDSEFKRTFPPSPNYTPKPFPFESLCAHKSITSLQIMMFSLSWSLGLYARVRAYPSYVERNHMSFGFFIRRAHK